MKKHMILLATLMTMTQIGHAYIQILPNSQQMKNPAEAERIYRMNEYNMQQERQELLREQVRMQRESLNMQRWGR